MFAPTSAIVNGYPGAPRARDGLVVDIRALEFNLIAINVD